MTRSDIIDYKDCECGCGTIIPLKRWHFKPSEVIPRFIVGHNPAVYFKRGNKVAGKVG